MYATYRSDASSQLHAPLHTTLRRKGPANGQQLPHSSYFWFYIRRFYFAISIITRIIATVVVVAMACIVAYYHAPIIAAVDSIENVVVPDTVNVRVSLGNTALLPRSGETLTASEVRVGTFVTVHPNNTMDLSGLFHVVVEEDDVFSAPEGNETDETTTTHVCAVEAASDMQREFDELLTSSSVSSSQYGVVCASQFTRMISLTNDTNSAASETTTTTVSMLWVVGCLCVIEGSSPGSVFLRSLDIAATRRFSVHVMRSLDTNSSIGRYLMPMDRVIATASLTAYASPSTPTRGDVLLFCEHHHRLFVLQLSCFMDGNSSSSVILNATATPLRLMSSSPVVSIAYYVQPDTNTSSISMIVAASSGDGHLSVFELHWGANYSAMRASLLSAQKMHLCDCAVTVASVAPVTSSRLNEVSELVMIFTGGNSACFVNVHSDSNEPNTRTMVFHSSLSVAKFSMLYGQWSALLPVSMSPESSLASMSTMFEPWKNDYFNTVTTTASVVTWSLQPLHDVSSSYALHLCFTLQSSQRHCKAFTLSWYGGYRLVGWVQWLSQADAIVDVAVAGRFTFPDVGGDPTYNNTVSTVNNRFLPLGLWSGCITPGSQGLSTMVVQGGASLDGSSICIGRVISSTNLFR